MFFLTKKVSFLIVAVSFFFACALFMVAGGCIFRQATLLVEHRVVTLGQPMCAPIRAAPRDRRRGPVSPTARASGDRDGGAAAAADGSTRPASASGWRRRVMAVLVPSPRSPRVAALPTRTQLQPPRQNEDEVQQQQEDVEGRAGEGAMVSIELVSTRM